MHQAAPSMFELGQLSCFGPDRDGVWHYLPRRPGLRRDPGGLPELTWTELGDASYLMFTATWAAPPADVEELREEIAARIGEPVAARVRLVFAPVEQPTCQVLAVGPDGGLQEVAASRTSGIPPYDALFNLTFRGEQVASARGALHSTEGRLALKYAGVLPRPVRATATFAAPVPALGDWVAAHGGGPGLTAVLGEAVQEGIATVRIDSADGDPEPLMNDLCARLLDEVARAFPHAGPGVPGDFVVTVTLERHLPQPVEAFADIAAIVAAGPAPRLPGGEHAAD